MLKAILFDLDNTLLLFDEREFFRRYFDLISSYFADLLPVDEFAFRLKRASEKLVQNDGRQLNSRFFMQEFMAGLSVPEDRIWKRFLHFYEDEFGKLRALTKPAPDIDQVFERLKQKNLKMAVATNPLFPESAQKQRLAWAGLGDFSFDFITHIENTHFCKPHPGYFREVMEALEVHGTECLFVGNDALTDLPAGELGMTTYLTTDSHPIDLSALQMTRSLYANPSSQKSNPDFRGPIRKLPLLIENVMSASGIA